MSSEIISLKENQMLKRIFSFVLVLIFISGCLFAGGWNNTLMGCRAVALGAAFAAIADDPSAIYYNPAGMVFQEKLQFL